MEKIANQIKQADPDIVALQVFYRLFQFKSIFGFEGSSNGGSGQKFDGIVRSDRLEM